MTEQWMPGTKEELMSALSREWELLLEVAENLSDAQMSLPDSGGWSPKDNLAHITEWMNILLGYHIGNRPSHEVLGISEDVTKDWDMEVINPILFERNKNRQRSEVMDELKQVYRSLSEKLAMMSFEELLQPHPADAPEKHPLLLWVLGNTTEHFQEHRETIERGNKK